jgi:hypothetical protein
VPSPLPRGTIHCCSKRAIAVPKRHADGDPKFKIAISSFSSRLKSPTATTREPPERNSLALLCDCAHVESGLHSNAKDAKKTKATALGILLRPDTEASLVLCQTLRPKLRVAEYFIYQGRRQHSANKTRRRASVAHFSWRNWTLSPVHQYSGIGFLDGSHKPKSGSAKH